MARPLPLVSFPRNGDSSIAAAAVTGYLDDWLVALLPFGVGSMDHSGNVGPTRFLGVAWYIVGIPLGVWLTAKNRPGLAGLALSTYVAPQYLLVLLWELPRLMRIKRRGAERLPDSTRVPVAV